MGGALWRRRAGASRLHAGDVSAGEAKVRQAENKSSRSNGDYFLSRDSSVAVKKSQFPMWYNGREGVTTMTNAQALKEAQKRWGKTGAVQKYNHKGRPYCVGYIALGMFFDVKGSGASWDEAFKEAEGKTRLM
jgi:hypothetical protein